jgi:hypothetical protein
LEAVSVEEAEQQRWQHNFEELLQELHVAKTGNQILFAFLLILPFTSKFDTVSSLQRIVYIATLVATSVATALIIAPVSHHRLTFRKGLKPQVAQLASRLAIVGLFLILISLTGALFLAIDVAVGNTRAAITTSGVALLFVGLWYVLPLVRWVREM